MRDFGFRIYRALCSLPEKPKEKEEDKKKDKKDDKKKDDDRKNKKDDKRDEKKNDNKDKKDDKEVKGKSDEKDKDKNEDDEEDDDDDSDVSIQCYRRFLFSKNGHFQDDDSLKEGRKDRDKEGKKKKVKLFTHDPYLLLSFVYFDQTHCGYIFDKDIEELIYTLGFNLSRAQVRKLVQKVVTRDSLHYRKLTDKTKDEEVKDFKKDENEKIDRVVTKVDNE